LVPAAPDHGDGFGEPGRVSSEPLAVPHICLMHEELLHSPLIVRLSNGTAGKRVDKLAALRCY